MSKSVFSCCAVVVLLVATSAGQLIKRWIGVSSSSLHLLHELSCDSVILCRCLLSLRWPVISPIIDLSSILDLFSKKFVVLLLDLTMKFLLCLQLSNFFHSSSCLRVKVSLISWRCEAYVIPNAGSGPMSFLLLPSLANSSAFSLPAIPWCPDSRYPYDAYLVSLW